MTTLAPADAARARLGAYAGLACAGLWVTAFGPALPFFSRDLDVSLGVAGLVVTGLAAGSISASAFVSLRLARADGRRLTALGLALLAFAPSIPTAVAASVIIGIGDGLVVAATHSLVAAVSRDPAQGINRLNLCFALGAIAGPFFTGVSLESTDDVTAGYLALAAVVALASAFAWRGPPVRIEHEPSEHLLLRPHVVVMGALLFLYVGAEIGLGSWVSAYTERAADAGVLAGAAVTSGYWGALAAGRVVSGRLLAEHQPRALLAVMIAGAILSSAVLALLGDVLAVAFAAAFVTGFAFGPVWPLAMAIGARGATPSTMAGLVTAGNSGALVFPVLQGAVLASAGPTEGVAVTPVLCVLMLALVGTRRARGEAG